MTSEWSTFFLEDCLDALIDYRGKTPIKTEYGIPLITAKVIKGGRIETPTEFIATDDYDSWMRRGIPECGDVVLTVEAPLGEVAQLGSEKIALAQRVVTLRGKKGVLDSSYLLYWLQSEHAKDQLKARATGTTVIGIKQSELRKIEITIPRIEVQQVVAKTLQSIDDRITLLRETNKTLESIAKAIFKSWFVDFDPVHAKEKGIAPEGMDEATAALFPDSFEKTEMGMVPKGWKLTDLSSAVEINPRYSLKKGSLAPYLDMANSNTEGHTVGTLINREVGSGAKFANGDTLLARITPCLENGKTSFVDFLDGSQLGWGSTEFVVLRPKPPLPNYFSYLLCRHKPFREFAIQSMSGTSGRQRIQNDVLGKFPIAVPTSDVGLCFSRIVEVVQSKITANHSQSCTLTRLRDTLLPRLISGQLRIEDAQEMVESV